MTASELMQAMADAGAPLEAIIIAVRALDEREAQIHALDAAAAEKRARDAERKRVERASSKDGPRTRKGRSPDASKTPPNDIYSNPHDPSEAKASPSPLAERVVSEWNAGPAAKGARRAMKLDGSRRTLLAVRLRDHTEDELFQAMANIAASKFHCGDNDRDWKAGLGWFLKAENFIKALEMEPAPTANGAKPAPPGQFRTFAIDQAELCRRRNDERGAIEWERKAGIEVRQSATGPPRQLVDIIPKQIAQAH